MQVVQLHSFKGKYCTIQAVLFCNNAHTAYFLFILKPVKKALFYDFFNFVYFTCLTAFLHTLQGMLFHKFKYPVRNRSYKNRNEYSCGKVDYAVKI